MVTYRGYKTVVLYDSETSYGSATTAVSVIKGKIQSVSINKSNSSVEGSVSVGFLLPIYKKILLKTVLSSAIKIVVPTKDYKMLINGQYGIPKNKIIVIPPGIDLNKFKNQRKPSVLSLKVFEILRISGGNSQSD